MEIECVGKLYERGRISIDPTLLAEIKSGTEIRLKISIPERKSKKKSPKGLSPAAKRLLKRMENAKPLGMPDDPHELSHSILVEERMEEKFPWEDSYEGDISEAFLSVAEQDWKDWANPEEDIYNEYKA